MPVKLQRTPLRRSRNQQIPSLPKRVYQIHERQKCSPHSFPCIFPHKSPQGLLPRPRPKLKNRHDRLRLPRKFLLRSHNQHPPLRNPPKIQQHRKKPEIHPNLKENRLQTALTTTKTQAKTAKQHQQENQE